MKKSIFLSVILIYLTNLVVTAQIPSIKKFDYSLLKDKILYIPVFSENSDYAKKYIKKGSFSKLKSLKEKITYYNQIWTEAMAKSSYDASPYEIKEFDPKQMFKEKNEKAILLTYLLDRYGNLSAELWIAGPKRTLIATAIINGLDLADANDIRLMINMLNYCLNEYAEIDATTKNKSYSGLKTKYKQNMIEFYNKLPEQTFYVLKEDEDPDKPEKAKEKNKEIESALKESWTLSKFEMIDDKELQKKKDEGVTNGFYWKSFKYYTNNVFMTYKIKYLFTIDRDEIVFFYYGLGNASFKASTVKDLQDKIIKKGEDFKKDLSKDNK